MRFVKLQVENFRAITSAELELGPGLNVLYGPNDLGKSTLGVALRAALLLPSTSSIASEYVPWHEAVVPVVTLTFVDDSGKFWKVNKRFTENDATLSFSKDGNEFSVDAHERAVDEKVRKILGWGLASPGGRTGSKGMPESFLANALLAAQTDVEGILRSSLEQDAEQSGKLALTRALSALAQDPLVRHVLDAAQKEAEQYFTATGRRKGGQNAPLTLASDAVKQLTDELLLKQQQLEQSVATEQESQRLHDVWLEAQHLAEAAEQSFKRAQAGLKRADEKRAAAEKLATERSSLAQVEGLSARIKALDAELVTLAREVTNREAGLHAAQLQAKAASQAVRQAEETVRKASSVDGEAERAVARAALTEEQAKHSVTRADLAGRLEKAKAEQKLAEELRKLGTRSKDLTAQLGPARAKLTEAQGEAAMTGALMNYGVWRTASEAARLAGQWRKEGKAASAEALEKTTAALGLKQSAKTLEDEVTSRRQTLPDEKQRAAFERLRREADLADAALGGGVTVVVKPRSSLLLRSAADESAPEEKKVAKELSIEADRRVQLSIGDLVDIEVIAGAAEKRKDAEHLRKKWKTEALPALEKASVRTLAELGELFAELNEKLEQIKTLRQNAGQLESEAASLRARAAMLEEKAAGAPGAEQLEERRLAVGGYSFEALEPIFNGMGAEWEFHARPLNEKKSAALAEAQAVVARLEGEFTLTEHRLADTNEKSGGKPEDVAALAQTLAALEQTLAAGRERLGKLEQERTGAVKESTAKLELAQRQLVVAETALTAANSALTEARAAANARQGARDATSAQLTTSNAPVITARVAAAAKHLATYDDVEVLTAEELTARERAVDHARAAADQAGRDHANAEGALSTVGGPQAREQVRQLEEAMTVARARERFIEVDASAWRLLVDAVRESEKEDSSSLGNALAGPVTSRFAELTQGRYPAVRFDPSLQATGIDITGVSSSPHEVIQGLSVGTRDHLATLVRLAIALQLKSAIVLDDHLVHTDLGRLGWFRDALRQAAAQTQVIVLTCRPLDYVTEAALPGKTASKSVDGTTVVDLARVIKRR
jgi:hypothetical protein